MAIATAKANVQQISTHLLNYLWGVKAEHNQTMQQTNRTNIYPPLQVINGTQYLANVRVLISNKLIRGFSKVCGNMILLQIAFCIVQSSKMVTLSLFWPIYWIVLCCSLYYSTTARTVRSNKTRVSPTLKLISSCMIL